MAKRVTVDDCIVEPGLFGGWRVSAIIDGHRVSRLYMGYSKRQAGIEFRAEHNGN